MEYDEDGIKIVLIGESGVGKTSIISRFIDNEFDSSSQPSLTGSFFRKNLIFKDGEKLTFNIWDTAGQEKYRAITKMFYKNAKVAILVYDISQQHTYDELTKYWLNSVKENTNSGIVLVLVANKSDLAEQEEVNENDARKFAEENKIGFFSVSAKKNFRIEELFTHIAEKITGRNDFRFLGQLEDINEPQKEEEKKTIGKSTSVKLKASNINKKKKKCC